MEFLSKITFFLHPGELTVVSFPKASAKLHGLSETTKFFGRKFSENFSARSAKTFYAPYSQSVKAHKKFFARRALFCSYKGAGPASLSGRKHKSRPFIAIRQIFQKNFYSFMPLNIKSPYFSEDFFVSYPPLFHNSKITGPNSAARKIFSAARSLVSEPPSFYFAHPPTSWKAK